MLLQRTAHKLENWCFGETLNLQIITHTSAIVLEAPSTSSPFYLYVERKDTEHCSNRYGMINGQAESCHVVFTRDKFQLNLRGNIGVNLNEIHSMDQSIPLYSGCAESDPDFIKNIDVSSHRRKTFARQKKDDFHFSWFWFCHDCGQIQNFLESLLQYIYSCWLFEALLDQYVAWTIY